MEESKNLPKHAWLRVYLPGEGVLLAFTYMDRASGWAARGVLVPGEDTAEPNGDELYRVLEHPDRVFRLPADAGVRVEPLSAAEAARLGLPAEPEWLAFFEAPEGAAVAPAPPPAPDPVLAPLVAADAPVAEPPAPEPAPPVQPLPPWRSADGFAGRFHAQHLDDIEALFFFPSNGRAERMWVRLSGEDADGQGYVGTLLNTPSSPSELAEGSQVTVRAAAGAPLPVYLSPPMKENLRRCSCHCQTCGFDLLLLPVEALIRRAFPGGVRAGLVMFTTRCALCGKTMVVEIKTPLPEGGLVEAGPGALSAEERRSVLWAAALFGAFLLLVVVLWLLRPAAYLLSRP